MPISPQVPPPDEASAQRRKQVQTFVLALDKALRAQRLYGGRTSAFVVKLLQNLEREISDLLAQGQVVLGVRSLGFTFQGKPLLAEDAEDLQLPWAFRLFCDGIREITFQQNLRWEELLDFLDILAINPRTAEDDLVTMLWERDFDGIQYYAADTFAAGLEVDEDGELVLSRTRRVAGDAAEGAESVALAPDDIRLLSGEGHLSWLGLSTAPVHSTGAHAWQAARLKSSLVDVGDLPRFLRLGLAIARGTAHGAAPAVVADQLMAHAARHDTDAMVAYLRTLAEVLTGAGSEGGRLVDEILSEERLPALARALADIDEDLATPMARLVRAGAAPHLTRLLYQLPECRLQATLERALTEVGADLTALYVERLGSSDPSLALAAIAALGRIGSEMALQALGTACSHPSTAHRRAALQTLASRYHPNVRGALLRCLDDGVAELRALALRILREARDPVVARAVLEQMRRPGFEKRAPDEAVAWYHCLAGLEQPGTVAFLAERLGQRNLLRSDIVLAHQVLAARALGEIGSPAAREVLEQTWRQGHLPGPLKTAVQAALHVSRGSDNA